MKSPNLTPISSVKSSSTVTSTPTSTEESESRGDSYYFPGCRRDANCNCEICIASFNATLDLIQPSIQRSYFTNTISASKKPTFPTTPISFNPSSFAISPPRSRIREKLVSEPVKIGESLSFNGRVERKKMGFGNIETFVVRLILGLSFIWVAEYGFSGVLSGVFQPKLSQDMVRNLGEKSLVLGDLNEKLSFLKREVLDLVDKDLSNCSYVDDSLSKIDQEGLLLNARYVLYRSLIEEVSIWGWPLQSAGLLTADFSSRSFTILSGRVTEWTNGEFSYVIRRTNSSWVQQKWSASPVQLDPNTWILEYKQRAIMENPRLVSAALKLLKARLVKELKNMQQEFWLLFAFGSQYSETTWDNKTPT